MKSLRLLTVLLLRLSGQAFASSQLPLQILDETPTNTAKVEADVVPPVHHRVAIIGSGAAGSSAAYHLAQYAAAGRIPYPALNITIYDPSPRAGGRTTTVNALDDPAFPIELGASIFVKVNHILYNASRDFDLQTVRASDLRLAGESDYAFGVWDGRDFVFKQASAARGGTWAGYWDTVKLLWKYGMAPIRTQRLAKEAVGKFLKMYDEPHFPFADLTSTVEQLDLLEYTSVTAEEALVHAGAGGSFASELVQSSTRVNYAQNLGQIHGLEGLVCMSTEGAMAVAGGNWQIFEEMVVRSGAKRVQGLVTDVTAKDDYTYAVKSIDTRKHKVGIDPHFDTTEIFETSPVEEEFDAVIVATPIQFSNITFHPQLSHPPAPIPYVTLHVTLFTSPHKLSPVYFGLADQKDVPEIIITTLPEGIDLGDARGVDAVGPAGFWSISTLKSIAKEGERTQYVYKIFSPAPVRATWLASVLGVEGYENITTTADDDDDPTISDLAKRKDVTWFHEKIWHSYPYEVPRSTFERTQLRWGPAKESEVWYTSGIESFISTMETSALMGKNVAKVLATRLDNRYWMNKVDVPNWIHELEGDTCPDIPSVVLD